jgi:hypothetical protein
LAIWPGLRHHVAAHTLQEKYSVAQLRDSDWSFRSGIAHPLDDVAGGCRLLRKQPAGRQACGEDSTTQAESTSEKSSTVQNQFPFKAILVILSECDS